MVHNFKKKFGQNFIQDDNIIKKIVSLSDIKEDSLIIEIGPGSGALTRQLVKKGKVICYEIDKELKPILEEEFKSNENIEIIFDDFLKRTIKDDLKAYSYSNLYVIANLPYYITTPIVNKIIEEKINPDKIVIMVQKEVGDRFAASPNSKEYSSITVFLNYYFTIKKLFIVSRNSFFPKPNVDSIVISLSRKNENLKVKEEEQFFKLVKDSFKQKRKTLKNNLKEYDFDKINEVLKRKNFPESVRAEQLDLETFIEISNNL